MKKIKLKKSVVYSMCITLGLLLIGMLWYIDASQKSLTTKNEEDLIYVSKLFEDNIVSVVATSATIQRPYTSQEVKPLNNFYDYKSDEQTQQNAIINYDTTYIQNSGVSYGGINDTFDVVSVLPGKVTSVKEDKLMGKIVTIEHESGIITTYKSLSEVTIKEGDNVAQSTVIGKAGDSNLEKDLGKHVLFEITANGSYLNPENCYNKTVDQLVNNN